jgi:hypothetical protein
VTPTGANARNDAPTARRASSASVQRALNRAAGSEIPNSKNILVNEMNATANA